MPNNADDKNYWLLHNFTDDFTQPNKVVEGVACNQKRPYTSSLSATGLPP